jgi:hypothetical protein
MIDWDKWRREYETTTWEQQKVFYNQMWDEYPCQLCYCFDAITDFFIYINQHSSGPGQILEFGGWQGHLAKDIWDLLPPGTEWHNYEVCQNAIDNSVIKELGYKAIMPTDFLWNYPDEHFKDYKTIVASHSLEHITLDNFKALIKKLEHASFLYFDIPLYQTLGCKWKDYCGSHILDASWKDIMSILEEHGFTIINELVNIGFINARCFKKDR